MSTQNTPALGQWLPTNPRIRCHQSAALHARQPADPDIHQEILRTSSSLKDSQNWTVYSPVNDQRPSSNYDVGAPQTPSAAGSDGGTTRRRVSSECAPGGPDGRLVLFILATAAQSVCNPARNPTKDGRRVKKVIISCLSQRDCLPFALPATQVRQQGWPRRIQSLSLCSAGSVLVVVSGGAAFPKCPRLAAGTRLLDQSAFSRKRVRSGELLVRPNHVPGRGRQREVLGKRAGDTACHLPEFASGATNFDAFLTDVFENENFEACSSHPIRRARFSSHEDHH